MTPYTKVEENVVDIVAACIKRVIDDDESSEYVVVAGENLLLQKLHCSEFIPTDETSGEEVILIQKTAPAAASKFRKQSLDDSVTPCKESTSSAAPAASGNYEDLDVTGSPLKCPFFVDTTAVDIATPEVGFPTRKKADSKYPYLPFAVTKARKIMSKIFEAFMKGRHSDVGSIPIWIVCDGADSQHTLFLGFHHHGHKVSHALITSNGPYYNLESLPSLEHINKCHTVGCPSKQVESKVTAKYEMSSGDDCTGSAVHLTCTWKRPTSIFSSPAPDAETVATVYIECEDALSPASQMYQELKVLQGLISGLTTGEISWFISSSEPPVKEVLDEVFTSVKEKKQYHQNQSDDASSLDQMIEAKFFNCRKNMEFTDQLWTVLMKCESYKDLKECLVMVFEAIAGDYIRPQIHVCNKTQVGNTARGMMRGQATFPLLDGVQPLEMLIEIGLEKIKNDYMYIFYAGELATDDQIGHFLGRNSKTASFEERLQSLLHLLTATQVVVILRSYLHLPHTALVHHVSQVLNQLKDAGPEVIRTFTFSLQTSAIIDLLKDLDPAVWQLSLNTSQGNFNKTLSLHIGHSPFVHLKASDKGENETADSSLVNRNLSEVEEDTVCNNPQYYTTFITSITDDIFI